MTMEWWRTRSASGHAPPISWCSVTGGLSEVSPPAARGTVESVSRKCPKPVFISTRRFAPCSKPLLAYDGSERAASAMQVAAEFCATLGLPLSVLTVNKDTAQGQRLLAEAQAYLRPYGIEVSFELEQTGKAPERISAVLRERATTSCSSALTVTAG